MYVRRKQEAQADGKIRLARAGRALLARVRYSTNDVSLHYHPQASRATREIQEESAGGGRKLELFHSQIQN